MEHKDIKLILEKLNIPVAYDHFVDNKNIHPPFVAYREKNNISFSADNKNYFFSHGFEIELVTIKKDVELEKNLSDLLTNNNIPYEKPDEIWDNNEKIYHIFYEI